MMFHAPPGVVYAYTPPGQPFPVQPASPPQSAGRPKRKQVKMACTNCALACKRCDESRPCERCTKYGIAEACVDGQRKERKKGIKRGPYKRKSKTVDFPENAEYQPPPPPPPPVDPNGPPPTDANGQPLPPPEAGGPGFYPIYYPPGHFVAVGGEGQEGGPPVIPYFVPPYGYPPPFVGGSAPPQAPNQDKPPASDEGVNPGVVIAATGGADMLSSRKRRSSSSDESAPKRAKTSEGETDAEGDLSDHEST
ncbi:hypothetical protein CPB85DRAFT_1002324 [Mucidula mucida]|nr:hypothetical protein CPB85DRAFT_1002324 [Mucidula mucida]